MKKMLFAPFLLLLTFTFSSQAQEDFPTTFDEASADIVLPPAIRLLEDGKKYFIQYPEKLNYHAKQYDVAGISSALYGLKIEPGLARKQADAEYTFRIVSPGITISPSAPVYYTENRAATYYSPAANVKGFVINLRYYFPITVEMVNKSGTVEKTFLFNTDSATWIYHTNFLADERTTEDWKPRKLTLPFATEQVATDNFNRNSAAIYKRMEYNTWYYTMEFVKKTLTIAYGNNKLDRDDFYARTFLKKKDKAQFPVLMDAIDKQHDLIGDLDDAKKSIAAMEELKKNQLIFDGLCDSLSNYSTNTKTVILSHAAWGALLTGQTERAANYFRNYYLIETDEYNMYNTFKNLFTDYQLHDMLKVPEATVEPSTDITALTPEKTAAPGLDPALINITRQDGEVEKENGEIIKGKISIDYMAKGGGIVDLDLGKAATVYFMKNGGETYQFAKVNNTKRISIGNRIFEPVVRKTAAALSILNAAGGDFGNTYFMEKIYEKNGFAVYRYWGPSETILLRGKDNKAVDLSSILSNRRIAKTFLESAKGTEEFIKSKGFKNNIDDAKAIIDFMAVGRQ